MFVKPNCTSSISSVPPLIFPDIIQIQHERHDCSSCLRSQHRDLRRVIARGVSGLKSLRADDITNGERACDDGAGEGPFRLPATIGRGPMVDDGQRGDDGVYEIYAHEEACSVAAGEE